jgi:hypothetical protein
VYMKNFQNGQTVRMNHGSDLMSHAPCLTHSTMYKDANRVLSSSYFVLHFTLHQRQCLLTTAYDAFTPKNTPTPKPAKLNPQLRRDVERKFYPTQDHSPIPNSSLTSNTSRLANSYTFPTHKFDIIDNSRGHVNYMRIIFARSIILD